MKRTKQPEKKNLHPRNQHRLGYDFDSLIQILPELKNFVGINEHQIQKNDLDLEKLLDILHLLQLQKSQ